MTHACHIPYCDAPVPPEMLMCKPHWRRVPKHLQRAVWRHYRPGQCDDKSPSEEWRKVVDAAIKAVVELELE